MSPIYRGPVLNCQLETMPFHPECSLQLLKSKGRIFEVTSPGFLLPETIFTVTRIEDKGCGIYLVPQEDDSSSGFEIKYHLSLYLMRLFVSSHMSGKNRVHVTWHCLVSCFLFRRTCPPFFPHR